MDLDKLKSDSDMNAEYNKYRKASEDKKNQIKQNEIAKIQEGFIAFFQKNKDFEVKKTTTQISATYKGTSIFLIVDDYANGQDPSMSVHVKIEMQDRKMHEIYTSIHVNKEPNITVPPAKTKEEIMLRDLKYHKAFVEGEIVYTFKYMVKGKKQEYDTIQKLLEEL